MKNSFKGFTLVEVLIVIIIVGILIAALLPRLTGVQATARDTARAADARNIATAAQLYVAENGEFPAAGCLTGGHVLVQSGYVSSLPVDPQGATSLTEDEFSCGGGEYFAVTDNTTYGVFAAVESDGNGNTSGTGVNELNDNDSSGSYYVSSVQ